MTATSDLAPPSARSVGSRLTSVWAAFRGRYAAWADLARPLTRPVGAVLRCVSTLGWLVLGGAIAAYVIGNALGWQEFTYAACVLLVLFALSCLLTIGRITLEVDQRLEPGRVRAGDPAALEIRVRNVGRTPTLPVPLDVPTIGVTTRFQLPTLGSGKEFEEVVVLPTDRRGVFTVGPASTLRGDPFGIVRRKVAWTEAVEFFVHPRTVPLDSLGSGMLKDLEGQSTNDVSMSDLAFHTLREYAPGDDRRHIHWLSSAKRSGTTGSEQFMVRQFLDTRRSHIGIVVDVAADSWVSEEEFEVAVSVAASVAARALRDELDLSQAAGHHLLARPARHTALDLFARAEAGPETIDVVAGRLSRAATGISAALLVTGPLLPFATLRRAAATFGPDVRVVAVRVELGVQPSLARTSGLTVLTIGALADLPMALAGRLTS